MPSCRAVASKIPMRNSPTGWDAPPGPLEKRASSSDSIGLVPGPPQGIRQARSPRTRTQLPTSAIQRQGRPDLRARGESTGMVTTGGDTDDWARGGPSGIAATGGSADAGIRGGMGLDGGGAED